MSVRATRLSVCLVSLGLLALLAVSALWALAAGTVPVEAEALGRWLLGSLEDPRTQAILLNFRLPRVLLAALAGAGLGLAGVATQAVLRNPLAEPFILGVSGGAAAGAVLALACGLAGLAPQTLSAFAGAAATALAVLSLARRGGRTETTSLVLIGFMVNALFSALIMFVVSTTSDQKLHAIMFWLYGDLGGATLEQAALLGAVVLSAGAYLWRLAPALNLLHGGETAAAALGVEVERTKLTTLILVSLVVGATVCLCGLIGFVGLMIPHLMRLLLGHDHRLLLPAAGLGGASFLVLADLAARTATSPSVLPVGVLTASLGAPFFLALLLRRGTHWW